MEKKFKERRKHPRVQLKKKIVGQIKTGIIGTIIDISLTGALVEVNTPLKVGSECNLKINLDGKDFNAIGRVERVCVHSLEKEAIIYRAGIKFEKISEDQINILKEYMNSLSKKEEKNE
jgi:c-di-GMP-binding flagellar brake protein YcgR